MSTATITLEGQRDLIERFAQAAAQRRNGERDLAAREQVAAKTARANFDSQIAQVQAEHARRVMELSDAWHRAREEVLARYETTGFTVFQEEDRLAGDVQRNLDDDLDAGRRTHHTRQEQIQDDFKHDLEKPKKEYADFRQQCEEHLLQWSAIAADGKRVASRRCRLPDPPAAATPEALPAAGHLENYLAARDRALARLFELRNAPAARFLEDGWPVLIIILLVPVVGGLAWYFCSEWGWQVIVELAVGVPLVLAVASWLIARPLARRQTLALWPEFQQLILSSRAELQAAVTAALQARDVKHRQLAERRDSDLTAEKTQWKTVRRDLKVDYARRKDEAVAEFVRRRRELEDTSEAQLDEIDGKRNSALAAAERDVQEATARIETAYRELTTREQAEFERQWQQLQSVWESGVVDFETEVRQMQAYRTAHFAPWENLDPALLAAKTSPQTASFAADPPTIEDEKGRESTAENPAAANGELAQAICFGRYRLLLDQVDGGLPESPRFARPASDYDLPAALSFPGRPSLVIEAEGAGRDEAAKVLQNVMLRLLTSFPPGKVRFTILDPVGLGQNFSAFMHLADFDERLVANRIWTEANHIQQRLADLTEHMEKVIQKYLRNEFTSIQEYNEQAGEVAEPYQILVVANFPANFSEEAARRLVSIAKSGARCGVYVLLWTDRRLKQPQHLDLAELKAHAAVLHWDATSSRFVWDDPTLARWPLELELPPAEERVTEIVKAVGRCAKETSRVEVPFEAILPPPDRWWSCDSRSGIDGPLGRAGAKKLQFLRLGKGTSQHVLIAGKTGSGKSTLLNAMITSLAAWYSPDELHFHLIDFKKGVEFKAYAALKLPHARVIAIESEREFGLSVLERLDGELKRRGDLFRQQGAQDLAGYRQANPHAVMPRILLIIDEFQEFFTSDDRISHDASLLLDRLVRQGRAFGIHVLLGSQTLAGAYSLARSTLGQMAVRIALQCGEADAHLILSEDNSAARLLNRPGEAIYNDANGLLEGNHPFQVVWLPDYQREYYLKQIYERAQREGRVLAAPTVFEGNAPADPASNEQLLLALRSPPPAERGKTLSVWLGSAVAIKDPTAALFRRQSGSNLLMIGQREDLALGMLSAGVQGALAQLARPSSGSGAESDERMSAITILDGTPADSPQAGFWERSLGGCGQDLRVLAPREATALLERMAEEVERRTSAADGSPESLILIIQNLGRFRDLKRGDDYGLSFDESSSGGGGKHLAAIIRDGPAVGVHVWVWCDSLTTAGRWFDRPVLREFDMRVLMQMSAADSSQLMDSPAASKLGGHLAYFYSEEQGRAEKFRPYGPPADEWLNEVRGRLSPS